MMADAPSLPAVIWDMGGILYRYFTEILLDLAAAAGWDVDAVPLGPTGRVADPDYEAMNAGRIDESDYVAVVRARLAAAGVDVDPVTAIDWSAEFRPAVWRVVEAVGDAGHPQALLTNDASRWLGERWWETWPAGEWFDAIIDVAELGARKPAAEPYLAAARTLRVPPEQCLFVDDLEVNCAGAEAVGMGRHRVDIRDPEGAMEDLARQLGMDIDVRGLARRSSRTTPPSVR